MLILDTETTGLSPSSGAEVCQIAIIDHQAGVLFYALAKPEREIPPELSKIHGITEADVQHAMPASHACAIAASIIAGQELLIYNAAFDSKFIDCSRAARVDCCMLAAQEHWGLGRRPKLAWCAEQVGHEHIGAHDALADVQATLAVWNHIRNESWDLSPALAS